MPVQKYKTFDEAEEALWRSPGDPANLRIAAALRRFGRRILPVRFLSGVQKYRSTDEANRAREAWEEDALRQARQKA